MAEVTSRRIEANGLSFMVDEAGAGDDVAVLLHGFPESRFSCFYQPPPAGRPRLARHRAGPARRWWSVQPAGAPRPTTRLPT